jgi:GT2 family glycosyltransferase
MECNHRKLALITVDYKSNKDTARLVASLSHLLGSHQIHMVVVNNATSKETRRYLDSLAQEYGDLEICHNPVNTGYFGGFNYGLEAVLSRNPEWIVFCNADIIFTDPEFFERLARLKVAEDVIALAPSIMMRGGRNQNPFLFKRMTKRREMMYRFFFSCYPIYLLAGMANDVVKLVSGGRGRKPGSLPKSPTQIYAPHGACFILNRRYFDVYPCLDDALLLWGEEPILAESIRKMQGRVLFIPSLEVFHNQSGGIASVYGQYTYRAFQLHKKAHAHFVQRYLEAGPLDC